MFLFCFYFCFILSFLFYVFIFWIRGRGPRYGGTLFSFKITIYQFKVEFEVQLEFKSEFEIEFEFETEYELEFKFWI